jgi:hypothetical protein
MAPIFLFFGIMVGLAVGVVVGAFYILNKFFSGK